MTSHVGPAAGERATAPTIHPVAPSEAPDARFAALFEDRYDPMVRLAVLLVDRVELAEEVVQDAFASTYDRWGELDEPAAYLRVAVVNRARDVLRRRRVREREQPGAAIAHDAPDEMGDAIAALPPDQRTAIVLRFYADLPIDQIAELMGRRPGTVKSWLHRALHRLREVIEP